jgi:3-oxoacyl-[acyl-carrier protein] reductase
MLLLAVKTALWYSKNMNKTIAITGASSEIGRAITSRLDKTCEMFILQCNRNNSELEKLVTELESKSEIIISDFTKENELNEFCSRITKADILINAAAVTKTDLLPMIPDIDIGNMISVNITALIKTCRAVIPYMFSKRNGIIINISSVAAMRGNRGQTVYAGTKGFVESFSRSLASEAGVRGIRVNCIAPGPIDAGSLKTLMSYATEEINSSILSKRLGKPEDVAALVKFLCSEEAEFINGQVLHIDGGFLKGI